MFYTELHRHLDVSVRLPTMFELAKERGLESQSTSLEAFGEKLIMRKPMSDLNSVLAQFEYFQNVLDRPDVLERIALEVIDDCYADQIRAVELRFSPGFVCGRSKLKWEDALDGFEAGVKAGLAKHPDMKAGLICIASRENGIDSVAKTIEFYMKHQLRFIGLDLAGPEDDYPCSLFKDIFKPVVHAGAPITIHSGEGSGPENVWEAIEFLGARRIGHGTSCVEDPQLMKALAEKKICLEMCPTSNWLTQVVPDLRDHPLPKVLRAGIPVCINTDDPGIMGVTLAHEIKLCREVMGMSEAEIAQTFEHARAASFLT